jgi:hypothetical protein
MMITNPVLAETSALRGPNVVRLVAALHRAAAERLSDI